MELFGAFDFGKKVSSSNLNLLIFANQNKAYTYKVYQRGIFFHVVLERCTAFCQK